MASNMNNYLRTKVQDYTFRNQAFTQPSTLYIALCTATPTNSNTGSTITEVSGGNYARVAITCNTSNWADATGVITNSNVVSWTGVTWSGTVTGLAICDASTAGNVLYQGGLTASKTVNVGDDFSFATSALSIQIDSP